MSSHFSQLDVFQNVSSLIQLLFSSFVRSVASRVIQNVNGLYVFCSVHGDFLVPEMIIIILSHF